MSLKVLLADDHPVVRQGLRTMLNSDPDFEVLAEAADGQEAVSLAAAHHPDVILMDMRMPNMDGLEATRRIKATLPGVPIIMLTAHDSNAYVVAAVKAGASGYLLKDSPREVLVHAMRVTAAGGLMIHSVLPGQAWSAMAGRRPGRTRVSRRNVPSCDEISDREKEVLTLLADGCSNKQIAEVLLISDDTVKRHVQNIIGKLGAVDRTQAAVTAMREGLIS